MQRRAKHTSLFITGLLTLAILLVSFSEAVPQTSAVRFAVIGDYGFQGQPALDVSNQVRSWNPDFIITVGDNNYSNGEAATIDHNIGQYYHDFIHPYLGSYGAGATVNRFFPSLGNHDWVAPGAQPYLDYFALPGNERYYEFVRGPVHFFAIDSDPREPDGVTSSSIQAAWLRGRLAASTATYKLVYFHHAPYSSGEHGPNLWMQWPFQAWGATAVLAGHDHTYERIIRGGFPYFVNGLGGRSLYAFSTPVEGSQVRYNSNFGAMLVNANAASITFQFITRSGALIDTYTINCGSTSIAPTSSAFTTRGGDGAFSVDATGGCGWAATANNSWINIVSAASGTGDGTLSFEVRENFTGRFRTGTITAAGRTYTINQDGGESESCGYALSPTFQSFSQAGGTGNLNVITSEECLWTASSNVPWVNITSENNGFGSASVTYSVAANTGGAARKGTITIAGRTFAVKQKGSS
jgi:tartrate-resistant acid phosphatase type 5